MPDSSAKVPWPVIWKRGANVTFGHFLQIIKTPPPPLLLLPLLLPPLTLILTQPPLPITTKCIENMCNKCQQSD